MCNERPVPTAAPPRATLPTFWEKMVFLGNKYTTFISLHFVRDFSQDQLLSICRVDLGITRAKNITNRLLNLCLNKTHMPAERFSGLSRFSEFMVSMSYLHTKFPSTTTPEKAQAASAFIMSLEELIGGIGETTSMETLPAVLCTNFMNALETHIAVFGERTPMSVEEINMRLIAKFEEILFLMGEPGLMNQDIQERATAAMADIRAKMIQRGMEAEICASEAKIEERRRRGVMDA